MKIEMTCAPDGEKFGFCPVCQREIALLAFRGELAVSSEPWRIFWQGKALAGVRPMLSRFLYLLLKRQEVPHGSFDMLLSEGAHINTLTATIHQLSRLLRNEKIPFRIVNIRAWGYRLEEIS